MEAWQTFLAAFGGTATLLAALALLFKSIVKHWLDKDVETFKSQLKAAEAISTERLKASLARATTEHQVTFSKLQERRADVIEKLHSYLVELRIEASQATAVFRSVNAPPPLEQLAKADDLRIQLTHYFEKNRIYLPENTCVPLFELLAEMQAQIMSFASYQQIDEFAPQDLIRQKSENWRACSQYFLVEVEKSIRSLEAAFRTLLYPRDESLSA